MKSLRIWSCFQLVIHPIFLFVGIVSSIDTCRTCNSIICRFQVCNMNIQNAYRPLQVSMPYFIQEHKCGIYRHSSVYSNSYFCHTNTPMPHSWDHQNHYNFLLQYTTEYSISSRHPVVNGSQSHHSYDDTVPHYHHTQSYYSVRLHVHSFHFYRSENSVTCTSWKWSNACWKFLWCVKNIESER